MAKSAARKIKGIAVIGSLAALALVLSPAFSALSLPGASTSTDVGANTLLQDEVIEQDASVVQDVSAEDLAACTSVNKRIDGILGVVYGRVDDRKVASDTLIAEYCARPVLVNEIAASDHASMSLVAYACDASSGRIGTAAIQDSFSDHKQIYCDSARELIVNETNTFLQSVEEFRTEYLPLFEAGFEYESKDSDIVIDDENTEPYFNTTSIKITLDEATLSLEQTLTLVDAGEYYPAAKSFDSASKKFIALFEQESE